MNFLKSLQMLICLLLILLALFYFYMDSKISHLQPQPTDKSNIDHSPILSEKSDIQQSASLSEKSNIPHSPSEHPVLIYNRVPKTGSTTLMNVVYNLHDLNEFRVVQVRVTHNKHMLTLTDQFSLTKNMSDWSLNSPILYHGHFVYLSQTSLSNMFWINLIRRPLDRLVSHYYFLRYGDDVLTNKVRAKAGDRTTFDQCVTSGYEECQPRKLWLQIPFFCGHSPHCWEPGSEWALDQAKNNLVYKYLVVGVTEDMDSFVEVLEVILPQFFQGATEYLTESGMSHIKKTIHKDRIEEKTVKIMKASKEWKMETDFYNFALKQFQFIKKTVLEQKQAGGDSFYVFEKVRPK